MTVEVAMNEKRVMRLDMGVGGGWTANEVYLRPYSPLALVTFAHGIDVQNARLDLDKGMFIDSVPAGASPGLGQAIATVVIQRAESGRQPAQSF